MPSDITTTTWRFKDHIFSTWVKGFEEDAPRVNRFDKGVVALW